MSAAAVTIHYAAPKYPRGFRPWSCKHEPHFVMCAATHIVGSKRGGSRIEVDHSVCLACGAARPCTVGGNVLVDLHMLLADKAARNAAIGMRTVALRDKWARIASRLFGEKGWNGRHEKVARMIDPNLTMRIEVLDVHPNGTRFAQMHFDPEYVRPTLPGAGP